MIRTASLEDAAALAGLSTQLGYPADAATMRQRLALVLPSPEHAVFVTELDGQVVAWMHVLRVLHLETGLGAEIVGLVVDEARRGAGIGAALVQRAADWARAQHLTTLTVRSRAERLRTHQFYQRLGFVQQKVQHVFMMDVSV
ncbi:MAG: hypothetical protein B7Z83_08160 [Thiomonas sp. 20-64-5]|nr:MAG: hypothetical protein B7Z83_08160 [Thiomonas sp. 20-64-5]